MSKRQTARGLGQIDRKHKTKQCFYGKYIKFAYHRYSKCIQDFKLYWNIFDCNSIENLDLIDSLWVIVWHCEVWINCVSLWATSLSYRNTLAFRNKNYIIFEWLLIAISVGGSYIQCYRGTWFKVQTKSYLDDCCYVSLAWMALRPKALSPCMLLSSILNSYSSVP